MAARIQRYPGIRNERSNPQLGTRQVPEQILRLNTTTEPPPTARLGRTPPSNPGSWDSCCFLLDNSLYTDSQASWVGL